MYCTHPTAPGIELEQGDVGEILWQGRPRSFQASPGTRRFCWLYMWELSVCNGENPISGSVGTLALLSFICLGNSVAGSPASHPPLPFRSRQTWIGLDLEARETSS